MKFDFNSIVELRQKYAIYSGSKDELMQVLLDGGYEDEFAMLTLGMLQKNIIDIMKNKYIDMIVQIPSPFSGTGISFCIVHCIEDEPKNLLTGIFNGLMFDSTFKRNFYDAKSTMQIPGEYSEDFKNFLENIENYFEGKTIKREDLVVNSYSVFNENNINPLYYTKQAVKIRKELEESNHKLLNDFAEIITIPTDKDIYAKCVNSQNFEYPFNYKQLSKTDIKRAIKVQKGDIICLFVGERPKFYLYNEDYDDVYIKAGNYCVVRCYNANYRAYIVNYLNDEKARLYFSSQLKGNYIRHLSVNDIRNLIVITPTEDLLKISEAAQNHFMIKKKLSPYEINELIRENYKNNYAQESQKMISDDMIKMVSNIKIAVLKELIEDDLNEVDVCFKNGAYKSAIILCGSILEAVLLDWLSEYENTDKLSEIAIGEDGRDLELNKIIHRLKTIIRPYWYESSKAHEIRKTRNMVHPKECIKTNKRVTKEECRIIIDNLKDIMESKQRKRI